jgi:hypothetical protein
MGTLEQQYDRDFDVRSDMHVGTYLRQRGFSSVNDLIRSKTGR